MKRVSIVGLCFVLASPAFAYDYHLDLSQHDLKVIGDGLDELPRKQTDENDLYRRLQRAINAQDQAAQKAAQDVADQIVAKKKDEIVSSFLTDIKAAILAKIAADKAPITPPTIPPSSPIPDSGDKK
jgi:hypothetical protein